jgi:hypothetical protein
MGKIMCNIIKPCMDGISLKYGISMLVLICSFVSGCATTTVTLPKVHNINAKDAVRTINRAVKRNYGSKIVDGKPGSEVLGANQHGWDYVWEIQNSYAHEDYYRDLGEKSFMLYENITGVEIARENFIGGMFISALTFLAVNPFGFYKTRVLTNRNRTFEFSPEIRYRDYLWRWLAKPTSLIRIVETDAYSFALMRARAQGKL